MDAHEILSTLVSSSPKPLPPDVLLDIEQAMATFGSSKQMTLTSRTAMDVDVPSTSAKSYVALFGSSPRF